jgi:hypothetical protein
LGYATILWVRKLNNVLALNFSGNPLMLGPIGAREEQQQTFLQLYFYHIIGID